MVSNYDFQDIFYFLSEDIIFTLTNSVDPDEMQQYVAFHQGLRCLQNIRTVVSDCRRHILYVIAPFLQ